MTELKPCPFCGGKSSLELHFTDAIYEDQEIEGRRELIDRYYTGFYVQCLECCVRTAYYTQSDTAIDAWNRRVTDDDGDN